MGRLVFFFFLLAIGITAFSQHEFQEEYRVRDSLIDDAMKSEAYDFAVGLMEQQFDLIKENNLNDSLYLYCYNYGRALWKSADAEKGLKAAEQISEKVKKIDSNLIHYLQTLNDLSWLYYETGNVNMCLFVDSIYLSICLENEGISVDKLNIAHYNMGFDYLETGKNQQALEHFQAAVDVVLNSDEEMNKILSKSYNALGAVQWHLGLLDEAETSYQASLDLIPENADPETQLEIGNILGNIALILQDNGEIIKAKEMQEEFIRIDSRALPLCEDPYLKETALRRMSSAYINLADIYFNLGDYSKSRRLVELAIEERKKILEPDDPSLASAIEHLAFLEMQSGNYTEAELKLKDYLVYCQKYFGENSAKTSWAYKDLGILYLKKKEYTKSKVFFNKAISSQKAVGNLLGDPYLAKIFLERSKLFSETGETELALGDLRESLDLFSESRESNNQVVVGIYLAMAELKIKSGDLEGAKKDLRKSIEKIDGEDRLINQSPYLLPELYYLQALSIVKSDSNVNSMEIAIKNLDSAIFYLQANKHAFQDAESKTMWYNAHNTIFEFAEEVTWSLYQSTDDKKWIEAFFRLTEENRTILLRNRIQNFSALDFAGVPDSILVLERKLTAGLRNEEADLVAMKNIVDTERRYNELLEHIRQKYPEYYSLRYQDETFTLDDVSQKLLGDDQSLLIYSVTNQHIYALLIDQKESHLFRTKNKNLKSGIKKLNDALVKSDNEAFDSLAGELYQTLFKPIQPFLQNDELFIVPDDELFFLNFEVLPNQHQSGEEGNSELLIHEFTISYLLSTTVALQFVGLKKANNKGLLTFAPGFTDQQKIRYRASLGDTSLMDKKYLTYIQQPFAVATAKQIAGIFSGDAFLEEQADETTFKEKSGKYGIIHLGTHAEVNEKAPMMSHLALSKNSNDSLNDGYLHVYEIYQMPLQAELAVLTACETGVGKQQRSEGVISLAHSFSYAGCPSIVMSLWNIDEKTSSVIINSFYDYLASGLPKNKALRQAKLDFLKSTTPELKSPYYWAGLVLLGDNNPVELKRTYDWQTIIPVIIVVLTVLVYAVMRRRKSQKSP